MDDSLLGPIVNESEEDLCSFLGAKKIERNRGEGEERKIFVTRHEHGESDTESSSTTNEEKRRRTRRIRGEANIFCNSKMADGGNSSSDESLDLSSNKFDPRKALYSPKFQIPVPAAAIYDNLSKYESVTKGKSASSSKSKEKSELADNEDVPKRKFLPHQEPVQGKSRENWPRLGARNILTKMKTTLGPLSMMFECMENKTRVKVYTRNARGIRGYVEAYVAAFDKHWNLALQDCLEVWTRKVKRKAPALGLPEVVKFEVRDEDVPKVIVRHSNAKEETLERHVPQMLLRGEQVAIIVKID